MIKLPFGTPARAIKQESAWRWFKGTNWHVRTSEQVALSPPYRQAYWSLPHLLDDTADALLRVLQ